MKLVGVGEAEDFGSDHDPQHQLEHHDRRREAFGHDRDRDRRDRGDQDDREEGDGVDVDHGRRSYAVGGDSSAAILAGR